MTYTWRFVGRWERICGIHGVAVGETGVGVKVGVKVGVGVSVGGTGVAVDGTGVAAGVSHPTKSNTTNITPIIRCSNFWWLIFHSFLRGD